MNGLFSGVSISLHSHLKIDGFEKISDVRIPIVDTDIDLHDTVGQASGVAAVYGFRSVS